MAEPSSDTQGGSAVLDSAVQDKGNPIAQYVQEIKLYEKETETWSKRREKVRDRYIDQRNNAETNTRKFNVFWSIVQTLKPAVYAKTPKPDIQRRFLDDDPVGRVAADVLERCAAYFVATDEFHEVGKQSVLDYLLGGRGTVWLRYDPTIVSETVQVTDDAQAGTGGDAQQKTVDRILYEDVAVDYVHPDDFGHNVCRTWQEVWLGWRIVYMTREELRARFKDKGDLPPLDHREENPKKQTIDDGIGKSTIYEVWDESKKRACWLHMTIPEFLDERDDPLKLKEFFPFPRPLYATLSNDSLIPVPDYIEYQDQALELDNLTARIAAMTKALKLAGVYDSSAQGLDRLLSEGVENQLIPVDQWAVFAEKGGIDGAIAFLPIEQVANALLVAYKAREQVKQDLYEITGMADIIRGVSDPNETAAAQKIKSSFGTMRLGDKQAEVQRFMREIIRIMVDIICGHFQLKTIQEISGVRLLTQQQKQMFAPYANAGQQPMPQQPSPMMGHNGGPPMPQPANMAQWAQMNRPMQ